MGKPKRDVGRLGQETMRKWAAEVGVNVHEPSQDLYGWDGLLEIALPGAPQPLDVKPGKQNVFVQVKASDAHRKSVSVKLSNLESMCKDPNPSVFLFLEFDGRPDPQRAYVRHVDGELIARTLKALREMDSQGRTDTHKRTLSVKYDDRHLLSEPSGAAFRRDLERLLAEHPEYGAWKASVRDSVGYETARGRLDLAFPLRDEAIAHSVDELLVDAALGKKVSISGVSARFTDIRFGIDSRIVRDLGSDLRLEMQGAPFATCELRISLHGGAEAVSLPGRVFSSHAVVSALPEREPEIRVETDFFSMRFDHVGSIGARVDLNIDNDRPYPLSAIFALGKLLSLLGQGTPASLQLHVDTPEPQSLSFETESFTLPRLGELDPLRKLITCTEALVRAAGIPGTEEVPLSVLRRSEFVILRLGSAFLGEAVSVRAIQDEPVDAGATEIAVAGALVVPLLKSVLVAPIVVSGELVDATDQAGGPVVEVADELRSPPPLFVLRRHECTWGKVRELLDDAVKGIPASVPTTVIVRGEDEQLVLEEGA